MPILHESVRTIQRRSWGVDPMLVFRLPVLILLLAVGTRGVVETDIWGHLRFGLDLLATRALPAIDRYSFTTTQPWINHEWGSDLLFALAYSKGGLPLLAALRACSVALTMFVLSRAMNKAEWMLRDGLLAAIVFISVPLLAVVRPQIFSIPLYALTLLGLETDAAWLPLAFAVWANLHGGWMLGLGAVVVRTTAEPSRPRVFIAAASAAATLINPYGLALWVALLDAIRRGWGDVLEWRPVWDLSHGADDAIVWCLVATACIYAVATRVRFRGWEWVWTACVAVASARARRHVPLFAITAAVLVVSRVRFPSIRLSKASWTPLAGLVASLPIAAAAAMGWWMVRPTATCLHSEQPPVRPEASAVQFVRTADLHGRMVVWFDWGLYAVWHLGDRMKVSIDNRRETVYSVQTVNDHFRFYEGQSPDYPDRIGADYVWMPAVSPALLQLEARGWHVLYHGPRSVILGHENAPPVEGRDNLAPACFPEP